MNSQDLSNLQEAYLEVYQLDEDKRPIYGRGGDMRRTETPLQIYGKQATARDKRTKHNIPKGGTTIDNGDPNRLFSGDYDRGSGNAAKRRAKGLTKPEEKKFPNRLTRSDKQGIKDSYEYDLYDIILSHLLDEGYAETQEQAEVIMVNMSEDWRESIVEEVLDEEITPEKRKQFKKILSVRQSNQETYFGKKRPRKRATPPQPGADYYRQGMTPSDRDNRRDIAREENPEIPEGEGTITKNPKKLRKQKAIGEHG